MATTTRVLTDALLARVRDAQGLGLSPVIPPDTASGRAFARLILSQAQQSINGMTEEVLVINTMGTNPNQLVYANLAGIWPNLIRVIAVQQQGRNLPFIPLKKLAQLDRDWFRHMGSDFECYSLYGREVLILYPGKTERDTVDLICVEQCTELITEGQTVEITDDDTPIMVDLASLLALIKLRRLEQIDPIIQRISERFKSNEGSDLWQPKRMSSD